MNSFVACLFFLAVLGGLQWVWQAAEVWPLVAWLLLFGFCTDDFFGAGASLQALLLFSLSAAACYQDWQTLYFPARWLWALGFLCVWSLFWPPGLEARAAGLFLGAGGWLMWKGGWMGSADAFFLAAGGFCLGLYAMLVCLFLAALGAMGYSFLFRCRKVPFLSFLTWSFCLVCIKGSSIVLWLETLSF